MKNLHVSFEIVLTAPTNM